MESPALCDAALEALLHESVAALRAAGRIVQKLADPPGAYRVDGGPPLSSGQLVALAWDTGLMSGPAEIQ